MAKYKISFASAAVVVPDGEWEAVGRDAHAVIDDAMHVKSNRFDPPRETSGPTGTDRVLLQ